MSSYFAPWYDPTLETPAGITPKDLEKEEVERLTKLLSVATAAIEIPRRLGGDATGQELSTDKKRAKRIAHVASQSLKAWGCKKPKLEDAAREAAIVDWPRWWHDHEVWLNTRRIFIGTWGQKFEEHQRFAKSAIVKLTNETEHLRYAMRD